MFQHPLHVRCSALLRVAMSLGSATRNETADVQMPPLVASVNSSSFPADVASAGARHGECAEPQVRQNTGHEGFKEDNSRSGVEDDPPSTLAPASVSAADELRVRPSASNQGGGSKPCPLAADHTAVASAAVGFVPDGWQPADTQQTQSRSTAAAQLTRKQTMQQPRLPRPMLTCLKPAQDPRAPTLRGH